MSDITLDQTPLVTSTDDSDIIAIAEGDKLKHITQGNFLAPLRGLVNSKASNINLTSGLALKINLDDRGQPNGIGTLNSSGKQTGAQISDLVERVANKVSQITIPSETEYPNTFAVNKAILSGINGAYQGTAELNTSGDSAPVKSFWTAIIPGNYTHLGVSLDVGYFGFINKLSDDTYTIASVPLTSIFAGTIDEARQAVQGQEIVMTTDYGGGMWKLRKTVDIDADNTGTIFVTGYDAIYDRVYDGNINPEWFGAMGDGITDDTDALNAACIECQRVGVGINLFDKTYVTSDYIDFTNICVVTNGSTIKATNSDSSDKYAIKIQGSITSYYNVTANANKYQSAIIVSPSDLDTLSLKKGDLIKIISSAYFAPTSGENVIQGEIQKVYDVDLVTGQIKLFNYLEDTYLTSNTARVAKVTPATFKTNGVLNILQDGSSSAKGVFFDLTENVDAALQITNAYMISVTLQNSFSANLNIKSYGAELNGYGYGVTISNATMYSTIMGLIQSSRHCITNGGGASGGVPWGNKVVGVTGSNIYPADVFDSHASCGSIYFENCRAINGYKFDGTTILTGAGFKIEGAETHITDCYVDGAFSQAVISNSVDSKRVYINGLTIKDCLTGINMGASTVLETVSINNVVHTCSGIGNSAIISIAGNISNLFVDNIHGVNIGCLLVSPGAILPTSLNIGNSSIKFTNAQASAVLGNSFAYIRSAVNSVCFTNCTTENATYFIRATAAINNFNAIGCSAFACYASVYYFDALSNNVSINGGNYTDTVTTGYFTYFNAGIDNLSLSGGIKTSGTTNLRGVYAVVSFASFFNAGNSLTFSNGLVIHSSSVVPTTDNSPVSSTVVTSTVQGAVKDAILALSTNPSSTLTRTITLADFTNNSAVLRIVCNAANGPMILTFPLVSDMQGRQIIVIKTDSSTNTITNTAQTGEFINLANTHVITSRFETVTYGATTARILVQAHESTSTRQNKTGGVTFTGDATTTTFTITHSLNSTGYEVNLTPTNLAAVTAVRPYVNNKTSSTFDVVFTSAPAVGSLTFDYVVNKS